MARYVLGISSVVMLVVLNAAAGTPSHLSHTLKAQEDVVAERPYDAEVYNDLGNLLALDERHQEAEEAYRKAIDLAPTDTLARFNLGVLLQQEGRLRDAQKELRSLLEIDGQHGKTYYQLGMLFEARGQRRQAVEHYAKAFAFDPELTFAYNNPHLIDNKMATEAMLKSARYESSLGAETPRLYGDPERIASLMLSELTASEQPVALAASEADEEVPVNRVGRGGRLGAGDDAGQERSAERATSSSPDRDRRSRSGAKADGGRRALTSSDLDAGSSIGQAQRVGGAGRRRPAIGVGGDRSGRRGGNAAGRADRQPATRQRGLGAGSVSSGNGLPGASSSDSTTPSARSPRSRRPSYRPRSRLSTGRLELKLLPIERPVEATERYADIGVEQSERSLEEPAG